uniref:dyslexia-associated protein KIAA0319 homolog isoform X2 n=1 Tax=Nyctereutes procyonoides TaxID=34880 RepID=UPI002443D955|nr:dyslexia-associated protein KIAA0319 homolog isoform X2 [Nyctereutes procyonoides]
MTSPTSGLSSLLLLVTVAGCTRSRCSEGRTFDNAIVSPNLETTRIMRVPQPIPVADCTAACCDLASCDLAWWFEGRCYLLSCPHPENCEPQKTGSVRSHLTFVLRPTPRPTQLLDYGGRMLQARGSPSGLWGDSPEDIRKDLPFLGKEQTPEEPARYLADYREPELDLVQPHRQQEPRGRAQDPRGDLHSGGPAGSTSSNGHSRPTAAEKQGEPAPHQPNGSAWIPALKHTSESRSLVTSPPSGEVRGKETFPLQEQPSSSSGEEGLMLSYDPPARLEFSPASTEENPPLTVPTWRPEHGAMTLPTSLVPAEPTLSQQPESPPTAPGTAQELVVSAGDNLILTLPENEVELKAFVVSALPAETAYSYEWSLMRHPEDYRDEIKERHMQTLNLSQLSAGLYAFKVAVSSENAFGEGFVNVTVKPESTDDNKIVSYHWEEVNGPFQEEKTPADSPTLRLSNLVPGNYTFRLTVTDSDGTSNSTTAALIVNSAVDCPPVANAGPNQTITLPQNSITLNGNQSSDDHQIVLYEWSLGPGSENKEVAMQGVKTPYLHLSAMQEGDYTFQLMVTDSSMQQSTAIVTVTVQPASNRPPVAVAGPDKELVFPVESTTLDGSRSRDDQGIVLYHWEHVRGPSTVEMENTDRAIATVSGLQVGTHHFQLTVTDQQGLSSTATLTVVVRKENNSPPRAQAGGHHVLVLPNNCITLDGSKSIDDQGVVSYLWVRDGQSPAAGDVIDGSDHSATLQLTNLVEGVYKFRLRVIDRQGASDTDTATVEVRPDPRKSGLVELILQVGVGQLAEQQKDTLVRQLAALLNVLDTDIKVQKIQAHSDLSTVIVFYVQSGPPFKVLKAADVVQNLHRQLAKEKADSLLFKVLRIDTAEWSIFYVTALALTLLALMGGLPWLCIYCCKRRKRTKIRKKTKYTILDNIDDQERMELRPKFGIKHRSTEHNSSLMVSESEFDSDQDTIFSRERMERENPKVSMNGSLRNGASFSCCSKDR